MTVSAVCGGLLVTAYPDAVVPSTAAAGPPLSVSVVTSASSDSVVVIRAVLKPSDSKLPPVAAEMRLV